MVAVTAFCTFSFCASATAAPSCVQASANLTVDSSAVNVGASVAASYEVCAEFSGHSELTVTTPQASSLIAPVVENLEAGLAVSGTASFSAQASGIYTAKLAVFDESNHLTATKVTNIQVTNTVTSTPLALKTEYSVKASIMSGGDARHKSVRYVLTNIGNTTLPSVQVCVRAVRGIKLTSNKHEFCQNIPELKPFASATLRVHVVLGKTKRKKIALNCNIRSTATEPTTTSVKL